MCLSGMKMTLWPNGVILGNVISMAHIVSVLCSAGAQWCFLDGVVGQRKVMFGRLLFGISVGRRVLFLWKEALLHQMNHSCARQALSQGQG